MTEAVRLPVVIPTLGLRTDYLGQSISSCIEFGVSDIVIVSPVSRTLETIFGRDKKLHFVKEESPGLASAINQGYRYVAEKIPEALYFSWLGDDDLIEPNLRSTIVDVLQESAPDFLYGNIAYIGQNSEKIGEFRSSNLAPRTLLAKPNAIPQPGSWISMRAFADVGGLDPALSYAFDQDLFTRLSRHQNWAYLDSIVARFRVHPDSLSYSGAAKSDWEALKIRLSYQNKFLALVSAPLEIGRFLAARILPSGLEKLGPS